MRNQYDKQLNELNGDLITMGEMVEQAIEYAIEAVIHQDVERAEDNVESAGEIDHMMRDIESLCMKLLMKQQPVASDLRLISAALKMITDMERIGDHAADISETAIYLAGVETLPDMEIIKRMAAQSMVMVVDSIQAFVNKDLEQAQRIYESDNVMDDFFVDAKNETIRMIREASTMAEVAADLLLVAKHFERIGDHACNIAVWVIYSISGERK